MSLDTMIPAIEADFRETHLRIRKLEACFDTLDMRSLMLMQPYLDSLRRSAAYAERILERRLPPKAG